MMTPEEVPDELVNPAVNAWFHVPGGKYGMEGLANMFRHCLAVVLPAHEAMVREKAAADIEESRRKLLDRPASQRPDAVDAVWLAAEIARGGA